MEYRNGLADRARFEAFSRQWRDAALKEAGKWCSDERAQQLLADAVLTDFRKKYADSAPPVAMDYFFRGQICLVYGVTGGKVQKLESYIAEHAFQAAPETPAAAPETAAAAPETPAAAPETPAAAPETAAAVPETAATAPETPAAAAPERPAAAPETAAAAPETAAVPQEPRPTPPEAVQAIVPAVPAPQALPAAESAPAAPAAGAAPVPEKQAEVRPDTFLDPVRTTFWTPDSERNEHVVKEIELLDEEESERSVKISFLNTILFLVTAGAFAFCIYETGFLQYLLQ